MIQQAFGSMITIMLMKFMLNDVPHYLFENVTMRTLKVTRVDERGATGPQLHYIAILSAKLRIPEPVVKEFGEAGVMIRHLETEIEARKRLGKSGGNPAKFRVERTEINTKMLDDLEATWHRIESDTSIKMQSALGILKEVMGHYFEQPAVAVYEGSSLVGIAVYMIVDDADTGVRDIHLCELASFTYEPGIGKMLVDEVVKIAKEMHVDFVTVSYGPGARGFYEKLGFISDYKEGGGIKIGNPVTPTGTCYPDAWRYVMRHTEAVLVHGTSISLGKRIGHAWVELPDGTVWEPSSQAILPIERFYELVDPIVEDRYTADEAAHMLSVGYHGPWSTEERMEHIGR